MSESQKKILENNFIVEISKAVKLIFDMKKNYIYVLFFRVWRVFALQGSEVHGLQLHHEGDRERD